MRPSNLPARRPAARVAYRPVRARPMRADRPLPGRRSVRLGGTVYDRDQVTALVSLALVAMVLLRNPEAATEAEADTASVAAESTAAASSVQAQAVLDVVRGELGYQEGPRNANKYGEVYGMPNVPWCMQLVWWAGQQAGASDLIPKTAYTPTAAQWYRDRGQWSDEPRVGSLVFFDWPGDLKNRISHVGLVVAVEDGAIVTYEGNTSSGPQGSQDDGDGVWERRRPLNSSVVGFGHPAYQEAP